MKCKCGGDLREDSRLTLKCYDLELKELFDSAGKKNYAHFPNYFVYSCSLCGSNVKITFEDIIRAKQDMIVDVVSKLRYTNSMTSSDSSTVKESNGISYCGMCSGFIDSDGYCLTDYLNCCIIRKELLSAKV